VGSERGTAPGDAHVEDGDLGVMSRDGSARRRVRAAVEGTSSPDETKGDLVGRLSVVDVDSARRGSYPHARRRSQVVSHGKS
jgi:hypothetical protein